MAWQTTYVILIHPNHPFVWNRDGVSQQRKSRFAACFLLHCPTVALCAGKYQNRTFSILIIPAKARASCG